MLDKIRAELAPTGILRAGINLSNFLLVTDKTPEGDPIGVSPDMARSVADRLDVRVKYITFASPGELADAAVEDVWDIGNIGAEPERAKTIAFTAAYAEIEATYLVPAGSPIQSVDEIDREGLVLRLKVVLGSTRGALYPHDTHSRYPEAPRHRSD